MISILRTLYNNGENNGDILVKAKDGNLMCHSFVLENTSLYFKSQIISNTFDKTLQLNFNVETVNIVLNYLYSEIIIDKELSVYDIMNLYDLISQLSCDNINPLKNHYLAKFNVQINDKNWCTLLNNVYGVNKYADFQECVLSFYRNNILHFLDVSYCGVKMNIDYYTSSNEGIRLLLFSICIEKLSELMAELKSTNNDDSIKKKQTLNIFLKQCEKHDVPDRDSSSEDTKDKKQVKKSPFSHDEHLIDIDKIDSTDEDPLVTKKVKKTANKK